MRFITITLIVHAPDPHTGEQKSTQERFREVIGNARLAEELGFDGFGVGERHERPFVSSSPTVVLSHVADAGGLTDTQHRASLELFQSDIAPVLRREIPDPPWGWGGGPAGDDAVPARAVAATG